MRPDIAAGPIGRKCSASNGSSIEASALVGSSTVALAEVEPTSDRAPNAAKRTAMSASRRNRLMTCSRTLNLQFTIYNCQSDTEGTLHATSLCNLPVVNGELSGEPTAQRCSHRA